MLISPFNPPQPTLRVEKNRPAAVCALSHRSPPLTNGLREHPARQNVYFEAPSRKAAPPTAGKENPGYGFVPGPSG